MVTLERYEAVDVLNERKAETAARWLKDRPHIDVVSRDRCGLYAQAGRDGAPEAKEGADRFHLVQNLRAAIKEQSKRRFHPIGFTVAAGGSAVLTELMSSPGSP